MANYYKTLGQSNPAATTNTNLYTVPAGRQAVAATILVANQGSTSATYRIAIRPAGATLAAQHYIAFDTPITGNNTTAFTLGFGLAATDIITVYASTANLSFTVSGTEIY